MDRLVHWLLFAYVFLQPLIAQDILCTVTQDDGGTLYSVPEFNADKCHYSWINSTKTVLGNHEGKMDSVVMKNTNRTLLTYGCSEKIYYRRDCISEGTPRMATCTSNCTRTAGFEKDPGIPSYAIAVIVVGVILVLVVLCFLFYKLRQVGSCNQTKCIYTAAKMPNHPPNETDVEAVFITSPQDV